MENGSQIGTYIAYGFVCLFLVILTLALMRSGMMYIALLVLPFMRDKKKANGDASDSPSDIGSAPPA